MSYMEQDEQRSRATLLRRMPGVAAADLSDWLALEPRTWVMRHGEALYAAGLTAQDAGDLYTRLGPSVAATLASLIDAGRMADLDIGYIHYWAASGLLQAQPAGRGRGVNYTRWVTQARRYIAACGGNQHLAALAAAARLSVEEVETMRDRDELEPQTLEMLAAFHEADRPS